MARHKPDDSSQQLWLVPMAGVGRRDVVADVALDRWTRTPRAFALPEAMQDSLKPGMRIDVPAARGKGTTSAWCLAISEREWDHTRPVIRRIRDERTFLNDSTVELIRWVSTYYCHPVGPTFDAMVPKCVRIAPLRRQRLASLVHVDGELDKLTTRQALIVERLRGGEHEVTSLLRALSISRSPLDALIRRKTVSVREDVTPVRAEADDAEMHIGRADCADDAHVMNADQKAAIEAINGTRSFRVSLLYGTPGSGKTEVYVRAARACIERQRQVLILVPEIALVTQIVQRLAQRFERVAVLHSGLPDRRRANTLECIARGEADVVIGTRSAVFAPLGRLGLIVVDEEQESSFKNLSAPRFHARDVAIMRARIDDIPILLGSATPSLETWHNATRRDNTSLLRLTRRAGDAQLPDVSIVDMDTTRRDSGNVSLLSPSLTTALQDTISNGNQAVLLHNRRGYATIVRCTLCGMRVPCARCNGGLVHHRESKSLRCHVCGWHGDVRAHCPDDLCGGTIEMVGAGIQRLEEDLARCVPTARVVRMDSDTMRSRADYSGALDAFAQRSADILIGTQMIAKGLDFPGVTLVGVLNADDRLSMPDLRAAERTFQLLVQVIGRAGRSHGSSHAIIQCANRHDAVFRYGETLDFEGFAAHELPLRERAGCPPFRRLIRVVCESERRSDAHSGATQISQRLTDGASRIHAQIEVSAAQPCPVERRRGRYRFQVVVRLPREIIAPRLLDANPIADSWRSASDRVLIDVDPLDWM